MCKIVEAEEAEARDQQVEGGAHIGQQGAFIGELGALHCKVIPQDYVFLIVEIMGESDGLFHVFIIRSWTIN